MKVNETTAPSLALGANLEPSIESLALNTARIKDIISEPWDDFYTPRKLSAQGVNEATIQQWRGQLIHEAPSLVVAPDVAQDLAPVVAPDTAALVALTEEERLLSDLEELAAKSLGDVGAAFELKKISKTFGISARLIKDTYTSVKSAYWHNKNASDTTPEQLAAEAEYIKVEEAAQEEANRVLQIEQSKVGAIVDRLKREPDLLDVFHSLLEQSGYICDRDTAASVWVSHGARLLPDCTSFVWTGSSASGKSALILKAAALLPPEMVMHLTSVSEQALFYMGDVRGKYLMFGEIAPTVEGQDDYRQMAMRQLISEGKLTRAVVEKVDGTTNEIAMKETTGPAVLIATTTREAGCFHDELQNRGGWFTSNDSPTITRRVLSAQADRAQNPIKPADVALALNIKAFQEYHRTLGGLPVVVPYADIIILENDHVTARRLFPVLLNYVKASALLHQHVRERQTLEGQTVIVAADEDYEIAFKLVASSAPRVLETCPEAAREAFDKLIKPEMLKKNEMWCAKVVALTGKSEATARRWLEDYAEAGLMACVHRDGRKKIYRLTEGASAHFVQDLGLIHPSKLDAHDGWNI